MTAKKYVVTEPAMSWEQISDQLGLPKSTVRSIYDGAMRKLLDFPKGNSFRVFITEQPDESTNRNNSHYDRH